MTTVDKSTDPLYQVAANYGEVGFGVSLCRKVSFSDFAASGDAVKLIPIPANSFVATLYARVVTAFDGTAVLTVGDDADPNGYIVDTEIAETSINTMTSIDSTSAAGAYTVLGARPFYTTADAIEVQLDWSTTPSVGELQLIAQIVTIP